MRIGILSKRTTHLTAKMKNYYEKKGFKVKVYTKERLRIDDSLLKHDFFILKSKQLIFLYAGYFLEANNVLVVPNTEISYKCKNRVEASFLLEELDFNIPHIFLGTFETLKTNLNGLFPLVSKQIVGSGSKDVKLIKKISDLEENQLKVFYLEKYILGTHYLVYFIDNEICVCKKKPMVNEHAPVEVIETPNDIEEIIFKWKDKHNLLFGHLDMIRESSSNKLYVVDPGTFPEFSNWHGNYDPVSKICDMIIESYEISESRD
ncbi:MAG: RimK family alpha-L-glutamate ligase [Promethearchaeota archaeon]